MAKSARTATPKAKPAPEPAAIGGRDAAVAQSPNDPLAPCTADELLPAGGCVWLANGVKRWFADRQRRLDEDPSYQAMIADPRHEELLAAKQGFEQAKADANERARAGGNVEDEQRAWIAAQQGGDDIDQQLKDLIAEFGVVQPKPIQPPGWHGDARYDIATKADMAYYLREKLGVANGPDGSLGNAHGRLDTLTRALSNAKEALSDWAMLDYPRWQLPFAQEADAVEALHKLVAWLETTDRAAATPPSVRVGRPPGMTPENAAAVDWWERRGSEFTINGRRRLADAISAMNDDGTPWPSGPSGANALAAVLDRSQSPTKTK
jgi:hypothetical protein